MNGKLFGTFAFVLGIPAFAACASEDTSAFFGFSDAAIPAAGQTGGASAIGGASTSGSTASTGGAPPGAGGRSGTAHYAFDAGLRSSGSGGRNAMARDAFDAGFRSRNAGGSESTYGVDGGPPRCPRRTPEDRDPCVGSDLHCSYFGVTCDCTNGIWACN